MSIERETIIERPVQHETVVTDTRGSGNGVVFSVLAAVVLVLLALWLFSTVTGGGSVDLPTVSVTP